MLNLSDFRYLYCVRIAGVRQVFLLSLTAALLPAQIQQWGGYAYARPAGYTERASTNQIEFTKVDSKRRTFCQLALQLPQNSLGSAAREIDAEWQLLVAGQFKLNGPPVTSALSVPGGSPEDIERTAPTSSANVSGMISSVMLLRFPGRYVSLLVNTSNSESQQQCRADALQVLGSIRLNAASPATGGGITQQPDSGGIPTGNTPQLFPGMPGWLPSGTGLPIPEPGFSQGRPVGLWWKSEVGVGGSLKAAVHVFLVDGIRATQPRLGGPQLFDLEGQKRQSGNTGVGTYAIEAGQFVQKYDGFENRGAYSTSSDSAGTYFKSGAAVYRPLTLATAQGIAGHWRGYKSDISFRADGTYLYGPAAASNASAGRYRLVGYLIQMIPSDGPPVIDRIGMGGEMLIIGSSGLTRVR